MNRDDKAVMYDNLVREGDRVNRQISKIKSSLNRTPEQETELGRLNEVLKNLEVQLANLFNQA